MDKITNNKYIVSGLFGVLSITLLYVNNNYIDKKEKTEIVDYIKIFLLAVSVSLGTMMVLDMNKNKSSVSSESLPDIKNDTGLEAKTSISQDIHTGNPNF